MRVKRNMVRIFHVCMVLFLFAAGFFGLNRLTMRKEAVVRNRELYDRGAEYDVLFIGNSHMINAVFPMQLYRDYGITSYNVGRYGHYIPESYYVLEDALQHTNPKLVVIDTFMINRDEKMRNDQIGINFSHTTMDSIPFSPRKIRAVLDLQPDAAYRRELLFPYSVYHNRWEELGEEDFAPVITKEKGAVTGRKVYSYDGEGVAAAETLSETADLQGTGVRYLEKMTELCRERGIAVLLVYLPYPDGGDEVLMADRAADQPLTAAFAAQSGIPYINFMETACWSPDTDFADQEHMNFLGGQKITAAVGAYLQENYSLTDHRQDALGGAWNRDYEAYFLEKQQALLEEDDAACLLMLCHDRDLQVSVSLPPDFAAGERKLECLLAGLEDVSYTEDADGLRIVVSERETGAVIGEKTFVRETEITEREE